MNDSTGRLPPSLPLDLRRGLTDAADTAYPLRWGILGAGSISTQWVEALAACPGAAVTAVAARDQTRAERFAARFGIAAAYGDYAAMVASPEVDIVYVGTVNSVHKEHTLLAVAAGKHVLCEKPLAENAADARAMYAAAAAQGVMLQDAVWTRFFPTVEHARTLIEEGAIGQVSLVQSDFFDPIYAVQAAPLAFGAGAGPTAIGVAGRNVRGAVVEYGPDRCAMLTFPARRSEFPEVTEIAGSQGRITLHRPAHSPTRMSVWQAAEDQVPSLYATANVPLPVQVFEYPLPGTFSMRRPHPNQHGFLYRRRRCTAAWPPACASARSTAGRSRCTRWTCSPPSPPCCGHRMISRLPDCGSLPVERTGWAKGARPSGGFGTLVAAHGKTPGCIRAAMHPVRLRYSSLTYGR